MKKLFLVIAIVFSGMLLQAQTFTEVSNGILGTEKNLYENGKTREKTDYGTVLLKLKSKNNVVSQIVISISNDNQFYETIIETDTIAEIRVGSRWSDFTFYYKPVVTKEFFTINSAREYSLQYAQSDIKAYHETVILKHPKENRWVVGRYIDGKKDDTNLRDNRKKKWILVE